LPNIVSDSYLKPLKQTDKKRYLEELTSLCIIEPDRYEGLMIEFKQIYPDENFDVFFNAQIFKLLPKVNVKLNEYTGLGFDSSQSKGKFIFIDFWGTWCAACLDESDKIDLYYRLNKSNPLLMVTTIACFDRVENVKQYMSKNKFSFPVLLSDGVIEKITKISYYPTKLLVFPNGTYIKLPINSDFNNIVAKYMKWNIYSE
jgi:thiol-disulfide isomerase/thioredoxin